MADLLSIRDAIFCPFCGRNYETDKKWLIVSVQKKPDIWTVRATCLCGANITIDSEASLGDSWAVHKIIRKWNRRGSNHITEADELIETLTTSHNLFVSMGEEDEMTAINQKDKAVIIDALLRMNNTV